MLRSPPPRSPSESPSVDDISLNNRGSVGGSSGHTTGHASLHHHLHAAQPQGGGGDGGGELHSRSHSTHLTLGVGGGAALSRTLSEASQSALRALGYAAGIILSLVVYAFWQERIVTKPYVLPASSAPAAAAATAATFTFSHSAFLVLCNRLMAALAAAGVLLARRQRRLSALRPQAPLRTFSVVSLSNLIATLCQYEALKWITFPTQTIFKCSKLIPVMILSTLLSKRHYSNVDYLSAALVGVGCLTFTRGNITSRIARAGRSWPGVVLMVGNMLSDSFLTAYQERLFVGYSLGATSQMLYVNLFSALLALGTCVLSGELRPALSLLWRSAPLRADVALLTSGAIAAQFCITAAIKNMGAVFYSAVMTVQQMLSVIISCAVMGTAVSRGQWLSCSVVFGSLMMRNVVRLSRWHQQHAQYKP